MSVWAVGCIVVGSVLILGTCVTVPPLRRRTRPAATTPVPAVPQPDDFPTAPMQAIPAPPAPAPAARSLLRGEDLLWFKGAVDDEGPITLGLLQQSGGQLGVLVDVDGEAAGVRLDRHEVQALRDALTCHLVGTAKPVRS